jgi:steroid 5-alpha reductase family enzyme
LLLLGLAASVLVFTILWVVSLRLQNSSIADVAWAPNILLIGLIYYFTSEGALLRTELTLALVAIWAVRLGLHLFYRQRLEGEDHRYVKWRDEYEDNWWWISYFKVFLLQSVLAWVVSLPIYFAIVSVGPASLTWLDYVGVAVFVTGFLFETVSDEHLRRFRADRANKGRVLDTGLWSYTRHPNYFGEALIWWGFGIIGVATGGLPGLIGPVILTYLLIYVSGIAMIEPSLFTKQGYSSYAGKTPVFLPLPAPMRARLIEAAKKALPQKAPPPKPKRRW